MIDLIRSVSAPFRLLLLLLSLTPALALGTAWLGPQILGLVAATILLLLPNAPEDDVRRAISIFRPVALLGVLPMAWMLLQIAPVPLGSVEHPIWRSASAVFSDDLHGHISIDLGFTLRAFFLLLSLSSLTFSSAVLARSRDRAETILLILFAIATLVAIELILLSYFGSLQLFSETHASLEAIAAVGTILGAAHTVHVLERHETRFKHMAERRTYLVQLLTIVTASLLCFLSLLATASHTVLGATAFGIVTLLLVILIKRLNLRTSTATVVAIVTFVASCAIIALQFATNTPQTALVLFSRVEPAGADEATLRMLSDASWAGAGVGTYGPLAALYQDATGLPERVPINTVTSMILGWGYLGAALIAGLLAQLLYSLLRGALSRGRDTFYAAAGAAALVTTALELYCDRSFTELAPQTFIAIIIGVGMSQTVGTMTK